MQKKDSSAGAESFPHFPQARPSRLNHDAHLAYFDQNLSAGPDLLGLRVALLFRYFSFWTERAEEITMIDVDIIVARRSTLDHLQSSVGNPYSDDLDRLAASLDDLALFRCESTSDESGQHPAAETVPEQLLVNAVSTAGEQL